MNRPYLKSEQKPYHIEASELGADIRTIKHLPWNPEAVEIRQVWDYRKVGLKVDDAREFICKWRSYHYNPKPRRWDASKPETRKHETGTGRYLEAQKHVRFVRDRYETEISWHVKPGTANLPTWNSGPVAWEAGGRVFLTVRHEYAEWGNKNSKYPTRKEVSYTTHLLREDYQTPPHARVLINSFDSEWLNLATENTIDGHDGRGKWQNRVLSSLLPGAEYIPPPPPVYIQYKSVAVKDGKMLSIYDGRTEYVIGTTLTQKAQWDHSGGYYCYQTPEGAEKAALPSYSELLDAPRAIIECECWGESIGYSNGKTAWTNCKPVRLVAESISL